MSRISVEPVRGRLLGVIVALAAVLLTATRVDASTVDVSGGVVTFTAGPGVANQVGVGASGTDILISDASETITLLAGALLAGCTGGGTNTVACTSVTAATFSLGDMNDTMFIAGVAPQYPITINGEAGNDALTLGDGSTDVGLLDASVTYDGGANSPTPTVVLPTYCSVPSAATLPVGNTFLVQTHPAAAAGTFTLASGSYTGPGGTVGLNGVQSIVVNTGPNNDTINVESTAAGWHVVANGGAGGDSLRVQTTAAGSVTELNGGDGDDNVLLSNLATAALDGMLGNICTAGEGNTADLPASGSVTCVDAGTFSQAGVRGDALAITDVGLASPTSYTLGAPTPTTGTFVRTGLPIVQFATIESLTLTTSSLTPQTAISLQVNGTPSGSVFTLGRVTQATVASTGDSSLLSVRGSITAATSVLVQQTGAFSFLDVSTLGGADSVTLASVGSGGLATIDTGAAADTIAIQATGVNGRVRAAGGDGNDTITLGSSGGSLNAFLGRTCVEGGLSAGTPPAPLSVNCGSLVLGSALPVGDTVVFNDQGDADPIGYTWTSEASSVSTRLQRTGTPTPGPIVLSAVETITLNAGPGPSTFTVDGTLSASTLTLNGGAGNDTLTVTATTGGENLLFNGGPGNDTATVQATNGGTILMLSGGDDADTLTIQNLGSLAGARLLGEGGADTLAIQAVPAGSIVAFDGGAAIDTVTLGAPSALQGTVCSLAAGSLQLSTVAATASETAASVAVTVTRAGGDSGPVSTTLSTTNGSAVAPDDYTATSVTVSFANEDTTDKTVLVPVVNDATVEQNETFTVTLGAPTGGATLGSPNTATVTIVSDDVLPNCGPRPTVRLRPTASGGVLQVDVTATPFGDQTNNVVQEIRFEPWQNATVTAGGQTHTSPFTFTPPPNTFSATFSVQRVTPGQPTLVPFTVVDACGGWHTFVGGGASAGF